MSKSRKVKQQNTPTTNDLSENVSNEILISSLKIKKLNIKFRNESQEKFWKLMDEKEITLCAGPAGTGKTFLVITKALDALSKENSKFSQIVLIKPVIEADEAIGFLPGDLNEKLEPYIFSYMYIFEKILGKRKLDKLIERGYIKVMALAYARGINLDNSFVIADEMQNATPRSIKTLLTRIGEDSKIVVFGDLEQSDRYKDNKQCGLYFAIDKLSDLPEIGIFEFKAEDIVRNPIIGKILKRFNGDVK